MNKELIISAIALIIAIVGVFTPVGSIVSDSLGNVTADFWDAAEGYKVDGVTVISGAGAITNGTSPSATSTLTLNLFCIQVYPTSTATAVKIQATTSANIGSVGYSPFFSSFGTCP
jgi:hypothetical protein